MTAPTLHFVVPGPLDQKTGGYLYDQHVVEGLRGLGWTVDVHELPGRFPDADEGAAAALLETLASLPEGATVVADGLAMGGLPEQLRPHAQRLRIVSLVHHLLADETGLTPAGRVRFEELEREALGYCMGVIVTSELTATRVATYGVSDERIRVVLPGTDRPATRPSGPPAEARSLTGEGPAAPRSVGEAAAAPVLLCVASVTPRKGHDVLVAALGALLDLDWRCVCAGALDRDPAHAALVLDAADACGVADRMEWVGEVERERLDALYGDATISVLASHFEGYGMALAESMIHGVPVVSTTGGAIPYTVPEAAGVLVEPGDADGLAAALRALLTDAERLEALAAGALRHGRTLPDWAQAGTRFAAAVEELAR